MVLVRRRYYIWLAKAYLKRWKKTIFFSLLIGIILFFGLLATFTFYFQPLLEKKVEKIGIWGTYSIENLPPWVASQLSYGLTTINEKDKIDTKGAFKWEVRENGKVYVLSLARGQYFHNGDELLAGNFPLEFKDVQKKEIDPYTIEFTLKDPYAPFLSNLSKPLFLTGLAGLGQYKVRDVETNAKIYLRSITMQHVADARLRKIVSIYATEDALKMGFLLGEIDKAQGLSSPIIEDINLSEWDNVTVKKSTNYTKLVSLFYNTQDDNLSNIKLRQALNSAVAEKFDEGERALSPIPPQSIYYSLPSTYVPSDLEIAKTLLSDSRISAKDLKLEISTTEEYKVTAEKISKMWKNIGIQSTVKVVGEVPSNFDILLYPFLVPLDPDQYTLWHSTGKNNITRYKNLRIDKLLEDGRVTIDEKERIKIYEDFQKYLLNDAPATFLYFPYEYVVERK